LKVNWYEEDIMIEVTERAAAALKQIIKEPDKAGKKVRVTFDTGG
jgi:Fe-S cluster assembly iron-binding protein IscA